MNNKIGTALLIALLQLCLLNAYSQSFYWGYERCGQVLTNVFMINAAQGYGVGASGQIRYTKDGGANWTFTTIPWAGVAPNSYYGVWGTNASNIWITGERGAIRKWNGSSWVDQSLTSSPFNTVTVNAIHGISTTDAWVVTDKNYSLHFDGSAWTYVSTGLGFTTNLHGVWMAASNNGWAVGDGGSIIHWNGSSWASQSSGVSQAIWDVWGTDAAHVWASTTGGTILFYNGSTWSVQLPPTSTDDYIKGVWGTSPTDVWAVGTVSIGSPAGTHLYHFDGTSWTLKQTIANRFLYKGRSIDATHSWAVGEGGCIYQGNGATWLAQKDETTNNGFRCAWSADYTNSWMAGGGGGIIKWDGLSWNQQVAESSGGNDWYGMAGVNASNIWTVGANGAILKYDGNSWNTQASGTGGFPLYGVWAADATNVWAVGANGIIIKYNGSTWSPQSSGVTKYLYAVWGTDVNNIWAVGESGTILKYNGTSWLPQLSGLATNISLNAVWGTASNNILACGSGGKIVKYDGVTWTNVFNSTTTQPLNGIWGRDASKVYITGSGSIILIWNGTSLSFDYSPEVLSAFSIIPRDAASLFAAGTASILTTKTVMGFSALPVHWGAFSGTLIANQTHLIWNTYNETNNKGFYVEKSKNGQSFSAIGFVGGKNLPACNYSFIDSSLIDSKETFYRLSQIDVDGKRSISEVITIHNGSGFAAAAIYPNPAHNQLFFQNYAAMKNISITDVSGRRIALLPVALPELDVSHWPKGAYWIQWTDASLVRKTKQIMIN